MPETETSLKDLPIEELQKMAIVDSKKVEDLEPIRDEAEQRNKNPEHSVFQEIIEGSKKQERLELSQTIVSKAMEQIGGNLGAATELDVAGVEDLLSQDRKSTKPKAQVYYKRVTEPQVNGFTGKIKRNREGVVKEQTGGKTEEVVIIVRLNNGKEDDPSSNTIAVGVVKQINGIPQLGAQEMGLFKTMSEQEFAEQTKKGTREEPETDMGNLFKGRLTNERYREAYKKNNGKTLDQHWQDYDKKVIETHQYWQLNNTKEGNALKEETQRQITGEYSKLLESVSKMEDVFIGIAERQRAEKNEETRRRRAEQKQQKEFENFYRGFEQVYIQALASGNKRLIDMIEQNSGFDPKTLEILKLSLAGREQEKNENPSN